MYSISICNILDFYGIFQVLRFFTDGSLMGSGIQTRQFLQTEYIGVHMDSAFQAFNPLLNEMS